MYRRQFTGLFLLFTLALTACVAVPSAVSSATSSTVTAESVASASPTHFPELPPASCPVTRAPAEPFIPPEPYSPVYPYGGYVWYGTPQLWTEIPLDGVWSQLPYAEGKGYTQKIVFWNESYDWQTEPQPEFVLSGRRLNGAPLSFETDHATNGYHPDLGAFILTGVELPALGCWEITGRYDEAELSFVIWVSP